jgi:small-conductance mechanosensitive channel/CRP-like cAMP-binding protein
MEIWTQAGLAFWDTETAYMLFAVGLLTILLLRFRAADHVVVRNTVTLFLTSLLGQFIALLLIHAGWKAAGGTLHEVFVITTGMALIRLAGQFLFRIVLPLARFSPPGILEDILVIVAYVVWGMVRLRYAGLDLSGIVTTSAVITAIIAFSMQDTLGNILGGLALELDSAFELGDWVKVDDVAGKVKEIRWRSTTIVTRNGETVVIPNAVLMKNKLTVLGRQEGKALQWRRWVWFNVDFSVAPGKVIATVEAALKETVIPHVSASPSPNCVLMDFDSNGYGRYAVRYWLTDLLHDDATDSSVRVHVYAALQRAGIRLAVSEHSVHMVKEDEKHKQLVKERELARRLAALKQVDLFAHLNDDELRTIAERLIFAPFAQGDVVTRQGALAHWLYIITSGEAEVTLESPGQPSRMVSTLGAGKFFGEMGLMTGEPRRATITARTEVECYRLDKSSFEDILKSRPAIAEEISRVLAERRYALDNVQQQLALGQQATPLAQQPGEILAKIKRFFGLGGGK